MWKRATANEPGSIVDMSRVKVGQRLRAMGGLVRVVHNQVAR